ncbi:MAG: hypothetical protein M3421_11985 [Bacteroidota bacterium]|nr:hypothetical protein [Bacteroidota bacterium]
MVIEALSAKLFNKISATQRQRFKSEEIKKFKEIRENPKMMRTIEWSKHDKDSDEQDIRWMKEFILKPFSERFTYICKLQMISSNNNRNPKERQIKWI